MKNTYMTPLRYKNFDGVEKDTKLHFHLTPREFSDWMIDNYAEANEMMEAFSSIVPAMENDPNGEMTTEQKLTMLKLVKILAELSYGKPSDDGEVFDKSGIQRFIYSAAYDAFRLFLFQNQKELVKFVETILNEEVISEFMSTLPKDEEDGNDESPALKSVPEAKDPKDMTHEELVEAMRIKNQTPPRI